MEYIPLEKPLAELEIKLVALKQISATQASVDFSGDVKNLEKQIGELQKKLFSSLSPYEIIQISRHPKRPNTLEIIKQISDSFIELHGDRNYYDDKALISGIGQVSGQSVVFIGHQKGRSTKENIKRNFGMPKPEGYRKALRIMKLAEKFSLPIITFIDTPGAYPGVGAEKRGQSEAIGKNIMVMSQIKTPIISFVIGEGGSGGALAIAVANRVHMLKYATYSVISPEGCASILMKDAKKAHQAANALRLTADNALHFGVIDSIIPEPIGGAHRNPKEIAQEIKKQILIDLKELKSLAKEQLSQERIHKYLQMGNSFISSGN